MYKIEWNHYMVKCKLWVAFLLFLICKLFFLSFETVYIDTHVLSSRYDAFFDEYQGYYDFDKRQSINEIERDEVMERYISYVDSFPVKHYLIKQTGWEAWIGNEKLDIVLLFFVVFVVSFLTTYDNETGMKHVKFSSGSNQKRIYTYWQIIILVVVFLFLLLSFLSEGLFYSIRYGLTGYPYPVQSLWSFENSDYDFTLWECCLAIEFVKGIGMLVVAELTWLLSFAFKKLWKTFAAGLAIPLLPYIVFNKAVFRYFIFPLNLLLGNGYFRGYNEAVMYDGVEVSQPVEHLSLAQLLLMMVISAFIIIGIQSLILWKRNVRNKDVLFLDVLLFVCIMAGSLCIALNTDTCQNDFTQTYYQGKGYYNQNKIYKLNEPGNLIELDAESGKTENVIRDLFSAKDVCDIYMDEDSLYYYVKEDNGRVKFYKINLSDFSGQLIYEEERGSREFDYSSKYLGIINVHNLENVSFEESLMDDIVKFWVDGDSIFVATQNCVERIDYKRKKKVVLVEDEYNGGALAYEKGKLYYVAGDSSVYEVDVDTLHLRKLDITGCDKLVASDGRILYRLRDGTVGILHNGNNQLIEDANMSETSNFACVGDNVFFVSSDRLPCFLDMATLNVQELNLSNSDMISNNVYNIRAYGTGKVELYIRTPEDEFEWCLADYDIITLDLKDVQLLVEAFVI